MLGLLPALRSVRYFFIPSFDMLSFDMESCFFIPSLDIASSFFKPSLDIASLDILSLVIPSLPILSCAKAAGEARPTATARAEIESNVRKFFVMSNTLCLACQRLGHHFDYADHSTFVTHCDLAVLYT